jgi:hypothetical protein
VGERATVSVAVQVQQSGRKMLKAMEIVNEPLRVGFLCRRCTVSSVVAARLSTWLHPPTRRAARGGVVLVPCLFEVLIKVVMFRPECIVIV